MSGSGSKTKRQSPSHEHCKVTAAQALARIDLLQLNPIPQVYEVWYRYFSGEPTVIKALDALGDKVTDDACLDLYAQLSGGDKQQEKLSKIGDQVHLSTAELTRLITSARVSVGEFGASLDGMSGRLGNVNTTDDLIRAVADLAAETRTMIEKNGALETQLAQSEKQINILKSNLDLVQKEAMIDGLTGLTNRKTFDKNLRETIDAAQQDGTPLVLMILDIDFFKKFNDNYGHAVGDRILRLVARALIDNVKGRDTAARYGGEEFAVILPETPLSAGLKVAENLRRTIENKELVNKTTHEQMGRITMSIGVAEYVPGEAIAAFIERADNALYDAKHAGRNRVAAAKPPASV